MIENKTVKVIELKDPIKLLEEKMTSRKKSIYVITQDLLLQDELDEIVDDSQFEFSTIYEKSKLEKGFDKYNPPSAIVLDYDTIKDLSATVYKLKEVAPRSPIILLSRKIIEIENIIFESILFYGMINEIYKNKEQFKLMLSSAARDSFTNNLIEQNSSLLDHIVSSAKNKTLNSIDSTVINIICQIKAFAELEGHKGTVDFIVIKSNRSTGDTEIVGSSGEYDVLKKTKRSKLPKDVKDLTEQTLQMKSSLASDSLESIYFYDNIDFEAVFVFKNLSIFKYGAKRIFNFAMHNSFLILSKIYEIKKREKEQLQNIITINELLKGESITKYQELLIDLSNKCNLNDFQKEQIWNLFHIYDLEKTLDLFKRDKKCVLSFQNKSFINLVKDVSYQIAHYVPREHSLESPTLYADIIRLVYIIKKHGLKEVIKNQVKYKLPDYIYNILTKEIMH